MSTITFRLRRKAEELCKGHGVLYVFSEVYSIRNTWCYDHEGRQENSENSFNFHTTHLWTTVKRYEQFYKTLAWLFPSLSLTVAHTTHTTKEEVELKSGANLEHPSLRTKSNGTRGWGEVGDVGGVRDSAGVHWWSQATPSTHFSVTNSLGGYKRRASNFVFIEIHEVVFIPWPLGSFPSVFLLCRHSTEKEHIILRCCSHSQWLPVSWGFCHTQSSSGRKKRFKPVTRSKVSILFRTLGSEVYCL